MTLRRLLLPTLIVALLAPTVGLAAPTVVYGPGLDAATAAPRARSALDTGDFTIAGALEGLVEGAPEALALAGGAVSLCGQPESESVGGVVTAAAEDVIMMDYVPAAERLDAVIATLPCGTNEATRDDLYALHFLRGQSAFLSGDPETAATAFTQAVVLDPKRPWDERQPPAMKDAYFAALQTVFDQEPLTFVAEIEGVTVDGAPMEVGAKTTLLPGRHFVGYGGQVVAFQVPALADRADGLATTNELLVAGLAAGESRYAPWLASLAAARGWTDVVVLTEDQMHRLDGQAFQQQRVQVTLAPTSIAGMTAMGAGVAVTGVGLALHFAAWDRAKVVKVDGTVVSVQAAEGEEYDALVTQNHLGLGLAIGGGAAVGVGAVLTIVGAVQQREGLVQNSAPWVTPLPEGGLALGIGGRF